MAVDSTLTAIRTKVRRLTRSPSNSQITDAQIDEYVNTFVLYDLPEQLRLFTYRKTFKFYLDPYRDTYETGTNAYNANDPLSNFKNKYITVHNPVYIGGYPVSFTQDRSEFFSWYPFTNSKRQETTGDGAAVSVTGTLTDIPVMPNHVTFTSINGFDDGLVLHDVPVVDNATGKPTTDGNFYVPGTEPAAPPIAVLATNTINYITGEYTITFPSAPAAAQPIYSQTVPYVASRPQSILYYDNTFTVRPIPDEPYEVSMEVYIRPTEITAGQSPELEQMFQYISYGAAKKIFEDRSDMDSVQLIMPEYQNQERLVLRRTLVQYSNDRVATIYTQGLDSVGNPWRSLT